MIIARTSKWDNTKPVPASIPEEQGSRDFIDTVVGCEQIDNPKLDTPPKPPAILSCGCGPLRCSP